MVFSLKSGQHDLYFLVGEPGCDMLGAVPFYGFYRDHYSSFDTSAVAGHFQFGDQTRVFNFVYDFGTAPDFQTATVGIIHEDQRDFVTGKQIAYAQVLRITGKIGIAQGLVVQDFEETGWAATVLHIGPTVLRNRCLIKAVTGSDEFHVPLQQVVTFFFHEFKAAIGFTAAVQALRCFHTGGKTDIGECT